jgi:hypothetical protein
VRPKNKALEFAVFHREAELGEVRGDRLFDKQASDSPESGEIESSSGNFSRDLRPLKQHHANHILAVSALFLRHFVAPRGKLIEFSFLGGGR